MDASSMTGAAAHDLLAPAKINLSLHVVGRRADGYHLLDGLVVFAREGDRLIARPAAQDELQVRGPFAAHVPVAGNSLFKALELAREIARARGITIPALSLTLEKNLPVASGIGGGSSDAASLMRHLGVLHPSLAAEIASASIRLGADVPMCLAGRPVRIRGIGEVLEPLAALPALPMVLVNPGIAMETPAVFRALAGRVAHEPPPLPAGGFQDIAALASYLATCRNDLEEPARRLVPAISTVVEELTATGPLLARMSGSGASVFGLYASEAEAARAAHAIARNRPRWWVRATRSEETRA
ncbi:4-(cytidine 5'-diphospho)-2-C-methyl-D-erythritol kinase [Aureimonas populi]|uniref:4-diphosphocytidyl-2-C-methyl-D-erythritol kinase n=1 Tax=Aureimonas populi TaxID=1701758 RepID=A0ABW5CN84_9HYPH|nr:4-(cytidine 5'-diphospho)-2-C-methyl-D-erythritol kinase [Aureimonas populi]